MYGYYSIITMFTSHQRGNIFLRYAWGSGGLVCSLFSSTKLQWFVSGLPDNLNSSFSHED